MKSKWFEVRYASKILSNDMHPLKPNAAKIFTVPSIVCCVEVVRSWEKNLGSAG